MNRKMNFTTTKNNLDDVVDDNYTDFFFFKITRSEFTEMAEHY